SVLYGRFGSPTDKHIVFTVPHFGKRDFTWILAEHVIAIRLASEYIRAVGSVPEPVAGGQLLPLGIQLDYAQARRTASSCIPSASPVRFGVPAHEGMFAVRERDFFEHGIAA